MLKAAIRSQTYDMKQETYAVPCFIKALVEQLASRHPSLSVLGIYAFNISELLFRRSVLAEKVQA